MNDIIAEEWSKEQFHCVRLYHCVSIRCDLQCIIIKTDLEFNSIYADEETLSSLIARKGCPFLGVTKKPWTKHEIEKLAIGNHDYNRSKKLRLLCKHCMVKKCLEE